MTRLRPGIWLLEKVLSVGPAARISQLDEAGLARFQAMRIPDRGPVSLMLGRARPGVRITTRVAGRLPLRVYTSTGPVPVDGRPVVISYHGGGFVLGSARQDDWLNTNVAHDVDAVVVAVDYPLAPGAPFPAAVDAAYETLVWAHENALDLGAEPGRIAVMGESAGGNLAAVVSLMARERGGPAVRHQALLYPATDLTEAARVPGAGRGIALSEADMEFYGRQYVTDRVDPRDWRISPVHAPDLSGLPPALIAVGGLDPLHDSGVAYAAALRAAGVPVDVRDYDGMPHGFLNFPYFCRAARPAVRAIVAAQRAALA